MSESRLALGWVMVVSGTGIWTMSRSIWVEIRVKVRLRVWFNIKLKIRVRLRVMVKIKGRFRVRVRERIKFSFRLKVRLRWRCRCGTESKYEGEGHHYFGSGLLCRTNKNSFFQRGIIYLHWKPTTASWSFTSFTVQLLQVLGKTYLKNHGLLEAT